MKIAGALVLTAVAVAFGLQGCAGTGGLVYANGAAPPAGQGSSTSRSSWEATGPNSAIIKESSPNSAVVKADTKENFEAVVAAVHKQMQPGGRWQFVDPSERATIDGNFADMQKLYDQYGSVDKMDSTAKIRLLADQSSINAILTKKDGDRLICESTIPVGSHLPIKTCRTYAEIQAEQRQAQESLRRMDQQKRYQNTNSMSGIH